MSKNLEKNENKRPLSPHLSIYKLQISSVLSITHRISGVCLYLSLNLFMWWFILWVFNKFDLCYLEILNYKMVQILIFLSSYGFFYHLCTGIRHLIWDIGYGYAVANVNITGWMAIIASLVLTISYWKFL